MDKFEEVIQKFIDLMHYREDNDVLGVLFYGSALSGYYTETSDIDLHIITRGKELYRGVYTIDGYRIEYFEKTITEIYQSLEIDFQNQNNALLAIIGYGKIMYDKNGIIETLKQDVNSQYKGSMPALSGDDAREMVTIIDNRMNQLQRKFVEDSKDFNYFYYTTVEKIRKFYSRVCGCPEVPASRAERIYTDEEYRKAFCKGHIPEKDFVDLYLQAMSCDGTKQDKMTSITDLFNYSRRNIDVDPNNYRIRIKSRHDLNNTNHDN